MLSKIEKTILVRALEIRARQGEEPEHAVRTYKKLTEEEQKEILKLMEQKEG